MSSILHSTPRNIFCMMVSFIKNYRYHVLPERNGPAHAKFHANSSTCTEVKADIVDTEMGLHDPYRVLRTGRIDSIAKEYLGAARRTASRHCNYYVNYSACLFKIFTDWGGGGGVGRERSGD
jgi:hypothetical protein